MPHVFFRSLQFSLALLATAAARATAALRLGSAPGESGEARSEEGKKKQSAEAVVGIFAYGTLRGDLTPDGDHWEMSQEAKNSLFIPSQVQFHTVFLKGVRNIYHALNPPYDISRARLQLPHFSPSQR